MMMYFREVSYYGRKRQPDIKVVHQSALYFFQCNFSGGYRLIRVVNTRNVTRWSTTSKLLDSSSPIRAISPVILRIRNTI